MVIIMNNIIQEENADSIITFEESSDASLYLTELTSRLTDSVQLTDIDAEPFSAQIDMGYVECLEPCRNDWWHDFLAMKNHNTKHSPLVMRLRQVLKDELLRLKKAELISILKNIIKAKGDENPIFMDTDHRSAYKLLLNVAKAKKISFVDHILNLII